MIVDGDAGLRALLERSTTVAMVGASPNPARPSRGVFDALTAGGRYTVAPVNPAVAEIGGIAAFASLADYAAARGAPDIVDVFRNAADAPQVVDEAIAAGAKAIWFQLGVVNEAAIATADAAGLDVVVDRCIKIEIARLLP
jgi:hypothetical protein